MIFLLPLMLTFLPIFLGIICQKGRLLTPPRIDGLEKFILKVSIPFCLFTFTWQHDLHSLVHTGYIKSYFFTFIIVALIAGILLQTTTARTLMRVLSCTYINSVLYTLPIITFLLKDPAAGVLGNIMQIMIIQPLFMGLIHLAHQDNTPFYKRLVNIIWTPILIMPALGLGLNIFQVNLLFDMHDALKILNALASFSGLFVFGISLAQFHIKTFVVHKQLWIICLIKNIMHPVIAFGIGRMMNLEDYWLCSLVIAASSPTALVIYLIAKQLKLDQALTKEALSATSILSLCSLPIIKYLICSD